MTMIDANASPIDDDEGVSGDSSDGEPIAFLFWLSRLAEGRSFSRTDSHVPFNPPIAFGRFLLESLLGAGTYGAVFLATDTELERKVALKVAWPAVLLDAETSRRFIEEPRTVAAISHPGIVEVYDSGGVDMAHYISFELISGPTLASWIASQNQISIVVAARLIQQVATAVHFANERGIIHRDLKPSNILLRPIDRLDEGFPFQPVVTDFGLARRRRTVEVSDMTATRAVVGTDRYMSPEQASGQSSEVGPASDVFSLGVILYELVTGTRPFDGETPEQIREQIRSADPPAIRPWRRNVPRDIETIIFLCLEKEPSKRYASAGTLADDLHRFLNNEPIEARPLPRWRRAVRFVLRRPVKTSVALIVALSAVAIIALSGALVANHYSSQREIALANRAAFMADVGERRHRYVNEIRHVGEAIRQGNRREAIDLLEQCRLNTREPLQCGIEWDLLWRTVNNSRQAIYAHPGGVYCLSVSPSGDLVASAGKDGQVILWEAGSWQRRTSLNEHVGEVNAAKFSADGSMIAIGGDDGRVIVRRTADLGLMFDNKIDSNRVFDLCWLGNSAELAVGGDNAILAVIDPARGIVRRSPTLAAVPPAKVIDPFHPVLISDVSYISEIDAIVAAVKPSGLHLLDPVSLLPKSTFTSGIVGNRPFSFVPMGPGYICFCDRDRGIRVINIRNPKEVIEHRMRGILTSLRYSFSRQMVMGGSRDGVVQVWNANDFVAGRAPRRGDTYAHSGGVNAIENCDQDATVITGGDDGYIRTWDTRQLLGSFDVDLPTCPQVIEFSPCGRFLAVVVGEYGLPGQVIVFDADKNTMLWGSEPRELPAAVHDMKYPILPGRQVAFDESGNHIAYLEGDLTVRGHDSRTGEVTIQYAVQANEPIARLQFVPGCRQLVALSPTDEISILDQNSGDLIDRFVMKGWLGVFRTVLGPQWLTADTNRRCQIRPTPHTVPSMSFEGSTERIEVATVSHDGRYLAIAGQSAVIYVWELGSDAFPKKCVGHERAVTSLQFASNDESILSVSTDGTFRLWDMETCSQLMMVGGDQESVRCARLNHAGDRLVLGVQTSDHRYGLRTWHFARKHKTNKSER